jgi:DNA-binding SARP family transcriptional activator
MGEPEPQTDTHVSVSLELIDGFELLTGAETVSFPMGVQRLLAFLALQARPVQRLYVAGKLWCDAPERRALASLRSTLWRANRSGVPLVRAFNSQLALDPRVRVDLREASVQARDLIDGRSGEELTFTGFALTGELLPDWYEDWLAVERERYQQLRLHALEALASRLTARARYGEAAEAALTAIACEPLRESAHRALIRVHIAEGNASEALRHHERFRALHLAQLGVAPSPQFEALLAALGRGEGDARENLSQDGLARRQNPVSSDRAL